MAEQLDRLELLTQQILQFRDERDWGQFHTFKNLASALAVECSELLELVQWDNDKQAEAKLNNDDFRLEVENEIADVLIYTLLLSDAVGTDPVSVSIRKLKLNSEKYPIDRSKGNSLKYNKLGELQS